MSSLRAVLERLPADDPCCRDPDCGWWEQDQFGRWVRHRPEDHGSSVGDVRHPLIGRFLAAAYEMDARRSRLTETVTP